MVNCYALNWPESRLVQTAQRPILWPGAPKKGPIFHPRLVYHRRFLIRNGFSSRACSDFCPASSGLSSVQPGTSLVAPCGTLLSEPPSLQNALQRQAPRQEGAHVPQPVESGEPAAGPAEENSHGSSATIYVISTKTRETLGW